MGRKSRKAKSFAAFEHFSGGSLNARLHNSGFAVLKKGRRGLQNMQAAAYFVMNNVCKQTKVVFVGRNSLSCVVLTFISDEKSDAGRQHVAQLCEGSDHSLGDGGGVAQDEKDDKGNNTDRSDDDCLECMVGGGGGQSAQGGICGRGFGSGEIGKSDFVPDRRRCRRGIWRHDRRSYRGYVDR